jgi:hypothetical protein
MAVLSPCHQIFAYVFPSHSFFALHSRTLCSSVGIATPPLGLPGCRRYHRAHFRPCRWSIRSDHLRRTETRVRPVRHLNYIHGLLSPSSPSSPYSLSPMSQKGKSCRLKLILYFRTLFHRWKTETNKFRSAPWRIESIPTIVKLKDVRVLFILFLGLLFPFHPRC